MLTEFSNKDIVDTATAVIALLVFGFGVYEFFHANAIRRYEKFHEMSVRFDDNKAIQAVCGLLNASSTEGRSVTKQQKEVFICFMEEVAFMIQSGIMKEDVAQYTFGYYARLTVENENFWKGLNEAQPYYREFRQFCQDVFDNPSPRPRKFVF